MILFNKSDYLFVLDGQGYSGRFRSGEGGRREKTWTRPWAMRYIFSIEMV